MGIFVIIFLGATAKHYDHIDQAVPCDCVKKNCALLVKILSSILSFLVGCLTNWDSGYCNKNFSSNRLKSPTSNNNASGWIKQSLSYISWSWMIIGWLGCGGGEWYMTPKIMPGVSIGILCDLHYSHRDSIFWFCVACTWIIKFC